MKFFGYIEDATKTLPGAAAPGELPGELLTYHLRFVSTCVREGGRMQNGGHWCRKW